MSNTISINKFSFRHISNWSIFPWVLTGCNGWEFTWLFLKFTRFTVDKFELDDDGDFPENGAW